MVTTTSRGFVGVKKRGETEVPHTSSKWSGGPRTGEIGGFLCCDHVIFGIKNVFFSRKKKIHGNPNATLKPQDKWPDFSGFFFGGGMDGWWLRLPKKIKAGYFLQGAESEGTCLDITTSGFQVSPAAKTLGYEFHDILESL